MASMKILLIALFGIAMSQAGEITDLVEDCGKLCLHVRSSSFILKTIIQITNMPLFSINVIL